MTPLDQLRLRLPAHDFDRLMQAAKPVAEPARDAMLKDIAAELGQHEVVGPGLLHRISAVQRRYDVVDQRRNGAKFGRSIMGLAGEVANPSLKHRPASVGFYVESPTQHRLHSAHKKRPRRRAGLRGSSSCTERIPDRLHSAGKTRSQGKQSMKAQCLRRGRQPASPQHR